MANTLSIDQIGVLIQAIAEQATGRTSITPTNTQEFVAVAQTALLAGREAVMNAISQLLSRTIYARRDEYRGALDILVMNEQAYGNHVRKISAIDTEFEEDPHYNLTDGSSIDQYTIRKPKAIQTNFYGGQTWMKSLTIFSDQVDTAMSGPDEFQQFMGLMLGNMADQIEQVMEELARLTLANFMMGKHYIDNRNEVHLLTAYNAETGLSLDAQTVKQPANYAPFIQWVYGQIQIYSNRLKERSVLYHQNFTNYNIPRHTNGENQRLVLFSEDVAQINASALPGIFHQNDLQFPRRFEPISYFQSPIAGSRNTIKLSASYTAMDGTIHNMVGDETLTNCFGVLYDRDAMGCTRIHQRTYRTPFNAKGEYSNVFHHFTTRYWNDFTENAITFFMD